MAKPKKLKRDVKVASTFSDESPQPDMTPDPAAAAGEAVRQDDPSPPENSSAADTDVTSERKAPAKKAKKDKQPGSDKAVETMFRNSYRAELDTIALAATKANIMISLNGFIISALMIWGRSSLPPRLPFCFRQGCS